MRNVYAVADNIFSPLGRNTSANMKSLLEGKSGIQKQSAGFTEESFYASLFSMHSKSEETQFSHFEQMVFSSAQDAIQFAEINPSAHKTGFILSTTKGNISLLEDLITDNSPGDRISLNSSADLIAKKLGFISEPIVVSHACISGLLAMITGMRLIQSGLYDTMVVSGGDLVTSFVYSGFRSFQAISPKPCKPFDASRDGISLGEAAATIILSSGKIPGAVRLSGGSVSNDANHISGPSRSGEELCLAIRRALQQAGSNGMDIDFISAHGTATRYNDEMEAKAIHLAGLESVPVNSLKGYYGHTLGAAGILESVVTIHSMKENLILPSLGFENPGTEKVVQVVKEITKGRLNKSLKTASGFGGCNAAIVLEKS